MIERKSQIGTLQSGQRVRMLISATGPRTPCPSSLPCRVVSRSLSSTQCRAHLCRPASSDTRHPDGQPWVRPPSGILNTTWAPKRTPHETGALALGGGGQMASRLNGPDDGVGGLESVTVPLLLETHFRGGTLVVRPVGELTPKTYEQLRDYLLKCAAEEPGAIVVDLACMRTTIASLLTVFPTVC